MRPVRLIARAPGSQDSNLSFDVAFDRIETGRPVYVEKRGPPSLRGRMLEVGQTLPMATLISPSDKSSIYKGLIQI